LTFQFSFWRNCDEHEISKVRTFHRRRVGPLRPQRWLIEGLWGGSSVGVIGGAPKCSKTWLGLDMALSVATGTPCLGRYAIPERGPVLIYLAEDAILTVRERVAGMARSRELDLGSVDIHVITAPALRSAAPPMVGNGPTERKPRSRSIVPRSL
jgi:RecA-family ATPase